MKLLKPHKWYVNVMSESKVLFKFKTFQLTIQEYYDPHAFADKCSKVNGIFPKGTPEYDEKRYP